MSAILGSRERLQTGWGPGLLTFVGVSALGAVTLSLVTWEPIIFSACTALLYAPVLAVGVATAEVIRRVAARSEGSGLVAITAGIAWAASWPLGFGS